MKKHNMDMAEAIVKIQQQLDSLERKIDTLIGRPSDNRPFESKQSQDRDYRERAMYKAICADCAKECEVPFRPSQDRPVYCKECFSSRKTGNPFKTNRDNRPEPQERAIPREHPFAKYQRGENRRGKKKSTLKRRRK